MSRRALWVNNDLQFGLARVLETCREWSGEEGIRVFRDLDETMEWIGVGHLAS